MHEDELNPVILIVIAMSAVLGATLSLWPF
jgi:hypothetical protein